VRDVGTAGRVGLAAALIGASDLGVRDVLEATDVGVGQTDLYQPLHNRLGGVFEAYHICATHERPQRHINRNAVRLRLGDRGCFAFAMSYGYATRFEL
jgi:hypothetical protein